MKHSLTLAVLLSGCWLLWSGHLEPFMLLLGLISVIASVLISIRMGVADEEGTPLGLGFGAVGYFAWLMWEVIKSNIEVTRVILDPLLPIRPRMLCVPARPRTEIGRVILANSITLTPGTVSVDMDEHHIWVHALDFDGNEQDLAVEMERRVCQLEQ